MADIKRAEFIRANVCRRVAAMGFWFQSILFVAEAYNFAPPITGYRSVQSLLDRSGGKCFTLVENAFLVSTPPYQIAYQTADGGTCVQICGMANAYGPILCQAAVFDGTRQQCLLFRKSGAASGGFLIRQFGAVYYQMDVECYRTSNEMDLNKISSNYVNYIDNRGLHKRYPYAYANSAEPFDASGYAYSAGNFGSRLFGKNREFGFSTKNIAASDRKAVLRFGDVEKRPWRVDDSLVVFRNESSRNSSTGNKNAFEDLANNQPFHDVGSKKANSFSDSGATFRFGPFSKDGDLLTDTPLQKQSSDVLSIEAFGREPREPFRRPTKNELVWLARKPQMTQEQMVALIIPPAHPLDPCFADDNAALDGSIYRLLENIGAAACLLECAKDSSQCRSVNFAPEEESVGMCALNRLKKADSPASFMAKVGFMYLEPPC